jgi:carboxymethylenebutenolidase
MHERAVNIATRDGSAEGWLLRPDGKGPWPAVILHTDIRGVRPVFQDMARRLAGHGFLVLLPNLYYRIAAVPPLDPESAPRGEAAQARLAQLRASLTREDVRSDHEAFIAFLTRQPDIRTRGIGVIGYCLSGAIALHTAADFPEHIAAFASFHGGRLATDTPDSPHMRAAQIRAEGFLGYAREDASMTPEMIERLETSLRSANIRFASHHYDARHGFAVRDSPAYDADAAALHWQAVLNLFERTLWTTVPHRHEF